MLHRESWKYTRRCLRGKYGQAMGAVLLLVGGMLFFRTVPCILGTVLTLQGEMTPLALLASGTTLWLAFSLLWRLLRFCVMTPVVCGVFSWYSAMLELELPGSRRVFFPGLAAWLRGMGFFFCIDICRFLSWLPFAAGCCGTAYCFAQSLRQSDGSVWLFASVQCLCLAFWGLVFAIRYELGAAAVPMLFMAEPGISPRRAMRRSRQMLRGKRMQVAGLQLLQLIAAGVPFLLPHAMIQYVLFLQIRMREWAQQEEMEHAQAGILYGAERPLYA